METAGDRRHGQYQPVPVTPPAPCQPVQNTSRISPSSCIGSPPPIGRQQNRPIRNFDTVAGLRNQLFTLARIYIRPRCPLLCPVIISKRQSKQRRFINQMAGRHNKRVFLQFQRLEFVIIKMGVGIGCQNDVVTNDRSAALYFERSA